MKLLVIDIQKGIRRMYTWKSECMNVVLGTALD